MNEYLKYVLTENSAGTIGAALNIRTNIVCNGFNMRDIILEVLNNVVDGTNAEVVADRIERQFKEKLGLTQGES